MTATVLVILDDPRPRDLLREIIDAPAFQVVQAPDAEAGVALAATLRPDCVLLDLPLPGTDALGVLERLQHDPRTREIPVIVLSADERVSAMERVLGGGAVDYLAYSTPSRRVAARVRGAVVRGRGQRDLRDRRTDFTAMLVHDLRTPLTVFQGYLDLLESSAAAAASDVQRRYINNMQACCAQMIGLIGEILDLSKLDAGKFVGDPRPIDLGQLVAEVAARFAAAAQLRGVRVDVQSHARSGLILGDPSRMDQVMMNLLGNAVKFSPDRGVVTVRVSEVGDEIEVSVADAGPGIPADELPLLFERFSQAREGRRTREPGTGLGLLICRRVVEAHGGRIWVESQPGRGACFRFRILRFDGATVTGRATS